MQDRYVGDVGDFAKYALLRRIAGRVAESAVSLGVVWCNHPNELGNNDGRHISYLHRADFAMLDVELIGTLKNIVTSGQRSIRTIQRSGIFPRATVFCDSPSCLPRGPGHKREERLRYRLQWLNKCLDLTRSADLVFFDPDNGIEVPSVPPDHPSAGKYIYWHELEPFWRRGQTLLIYHHLNRTQPAVKQIANLDSMIKARLEGVAATPLVFRRGSCRVFLLAYRRSALGKEINCRASELLDGQWAAHFRSF